MHEDYTPGGLIALEYCCSQAQVGTMLLYLHTPH